MLKNYLKIAWRNLIKNKTFSFINISGLSIGIAACLLILQYVSFELSFDRFNTNGEDIYRVVNDRYQDGRRVQHGTITYSAIGKAMQDDFPEVIDHCRVIPNSKSIISYKDKRIDEQDILAVDNSFLTMFSYPFLSGDANNALQQPRSLVLSQSLAKKIFNIDNNNYASLIGKEIIINKESEPYKVTGICRDVPGNSHLQFDILISYITLYSGPDAWQEANYDFTVSDFWHYVQLKPGTNYRTLETKLAAFSERYFQGSKVSGADEKFYLQPLLRAHLYSNFEYEIAITVNASVVWGLWVIALLIIVIAWANYINLTTARLMERAKEVGIRKVSGATKTQLKSQFLSESMIINAFAFLTALLIVFVFQNSFNELIQQHLSLAYLIKQGLNDSGIFLLFIVLLLSGVIISGFYPAFVMSSLKPVFVLKGKFTKTAGGTFFRKGLVIGQFAITVALIIGTVVVYSQMRFVSEQDLGYSMSRVLVIKGPQLSGWDSTFIAKQNSFMSQAKQLPAVQGAAFSQRLPGNELGRNFDVHIADVPFPQNITVRRNNISRDFITLYEMALLAGRDFSAADYNSDWDALHNIIINEMTAQQLGFNHPEKAIGRQIISGGKKWDIIGVVANFHQKSLRYPIEATIFLPASSTLSPFSLKIDLHNLKQSLRSLKNIYEQFFPGNVFDYYFLDEAFNGQYAGDLLFEKVFGIFSGFAILIACLGLLGLSIFSITQRTKEIGVRKVLGASVTAIVFLLSKEFIRLIVIAFAIAAPLAWFIMNSWLNNFAYRIDISWWVFLLAAGLALMIILMTVSFQTIKAARVNPVESLRYE